jgi:hypothetical protein
MILQVMSPRDAIRRLVEDLPEEDLPTALRVLEALRDTGDPVSRALVHAPLDDEPDDDDADGGLTEARADADAGRGIATPDLRRRLGLP